MSNWTRCKSSFLSAPQLSCVQIVNTPEKRNKAKVFSLVGKTARLRLILPTLAFEHYGQEISGLDGTEEGTYRVVPNINSVCWASTERESYEST